MTIERCVKLLEIHYVVTNNNLHKATSGEVLDLHKVEYYEEQLRFYSQTIAYLNEYKNIVEDLNEKI